MRRDTRPCPCCEPVCPPADGALAPRLASVHGVIFTSLREYLVATHGRATAADVFAAEPEYLLSESYPDESLHRLIALAAAQTGRDADDLLVGFGVFTAETTFGRLYPAFFAEAASTRDFLLTVEDRIHELVRATIPSAGPPRLDVTALGEDGVTITYDSPRRLCVLLRGLTEGAARRYDERAELDERTCMLRGDDVCTFDVRFSAGSPRA
jgi:heme-NO-binding protein